MSRLLIKNANILVSNNKFITGDLLVNDNVIEEIGSIKEEEAEDKIDAKGLKVIPGLIDIHTHGGMGIDIVDCSEDELDRLSRFYASNGVTGYLATVGTVSKDKITASLIKIKESMERGNDGAKILGVHMEGPYISKEFKGAQNEEDIRKPDAQEFKEFSRLSGDNIKLITIAPELEGAIDFINTISKEGVVISIGHCGCSYETSIKAIDAGAKSATHFLNGMKGFHQHEPSIVGAALERDIYCEMICDGRHLHPGTVKMLVKVKGVKKLIMITDSIMAAGLGDGVYDGFIKVIVKDGDAKLESGSRAGSTLTAINALRNVIKFTNIDLVQAVRMISENPAKLLDIYDKKGSLEEGKDADMIIVDDNLDLKYTISEGKVTFKA
ncbi:MAG: N-acetylglucosamine-6-phosphate deacetylase [Clostridium sp.]|nr:N-acetylglucosamine-6-phosphate deacetylase [Clostridium sp.]